MSDEQQKKYWIYAQIDEEDRDALMAIASHEGKHVSVVARESIQYYIGDWTADDDNPNDPDVQIRSLFNINRKSANRFVMLKSLAYTWNDTGSDQDYEALEKACEIAKVDIETVLDHINKASSYVPTSISENPIGQNAAMQWLEETVVDTGKMWSVTELQSMAEDRGFKWHTITAAKRKLGIQSIRDGTGWSWIRGPQSANRSLPKTQQADDEEDDMEF